MNSSAKLLRTAVSQPMLRNHLSTSSLVAINCHSSSLARLSCEHYKRLFPVTLVNSDGSTLRIRYHEPRRIVTLPLDVTQLTEAERNLALEKRKPISKIVVEEEIIDEFSVDKYDFMWKK